MRKYQCEATKITSLAPLNYEKRRSLGIHPTYVFFLACLSTQAILVASNSTKNLRKITASTSAVQQKFKL